MSKKSTLLKRDAVIAIAAGILGFIADYLLNLVLSRMLGTHEFGDFRVARAFAVFCGALVLLGGDRAAPRMLAEPLDRREFGVVWEYLRFYGLLGLLISVVIIAVVWLIGYIYHGGTWDPMDHHAVAIMALAIPFMAAGALAGRTLQSVGRTFLAAMPWRVGAPVLLLVALVLVRFVMEQVGLYEVLWLAILTIVVITLAQWAMVRRHALKVIKFASEVRTPRAWLGISVPMMGVFLVTIGLAQSDLYFLEWLGAEGEVGHYAAALTSAHFIPLIQTSIIALFAPLVARDINSGSVQTNTAFLQGQRVMAVALVPVILGFALGAVPVMSLFGSTYPDAAPALRLLAIGNGTWAMAALSALWLQYRGRGLAVMRITVITLLGDSVLNVLLIPEFGTIGAAASSAATSTAAAAAIAWIARRPSREKDGQV
ncbi:MAG TPA: oligosaccharide flippase family protein [Rhodothermales bacterium]|nr:oligosaccharide flippase family protein [Rhodothermales bacterium]